MNENELKSMVEKLLGEMIGKVNTSSNNKDVFSTISNTMVDENGCIDDITQIDLRKQLLVINPKDEAVY